MFIGSAPGRPWLDKFYKLRWVCIIIEFAVVFHHSIFQRKVETKVWNLIGASREEPSDDGPARDDVGAEELVGRVDDADDEPDEVATKWLRFGCREVLSLEPVLVAFVGPESHLK